MEVWFVPGKTTNRAKVLSFAKYSLKKYSFYEYVKYVICDTFGSNSWGKIQIFLHLRDTY